MTEIMPFPENNYETVLLDRPFGSAAFAFLGIYKRGEIMALRLIACTVAASAAVGTLAGAGFTVGTADALHAAPLFLPDVPNCEADNQCNNRNYDDVIHKTAPL